MARILIVGYGNPLRCDDGLGWRAAEQLSRLSLPGVEVVTCHQLTPELADSLRGVETVLFVDAAHGHRQSEELTCDPVIPQDGPLYSHHFSPPMILGLAQHLYGARPKAFAITLLGRRFDHGETLSPEVQSGLPTLIALAANLIAGGRARDATTDFSMLEGDPSPRRGSSDNAEPLHHDLIA